MHKLAYQIASHSVARGWISDDDLAICCYAVERRLLSAFFFLVLSLTVAPLKKIPEAIIFVSVVLAFRQRMGGIHANNEWTCLLISISSVLISVAILGPYFGRLSVKVIYTFCVVVLVFTFSLEPSYPSQVHFDQQAIVANTKRKNVLLAMLALLQIVSVRWFGSFFIIYSSLGLSFVDITVIIGKYIHRKGMNVT